MFTDVIAKRTNNFLSLFVPACRHAAGTISSSSVLDVWRMASEDSDELVPGLLPVHRLSDLHDLDETFCRPVSADGDELDAAGELFEVLLLRTLHRILPKERNDRLQQILTTTHGVAEHVLPVVVIPPVRDHITNTEELTKMFETRDTGSTLSLRIREIPGNRFCSRLGPAGLAAGRNRSRSTLLRLRNRSPNHGTRSAFPAGFPHSSRCHHGKRPVGRYEVVRDTPGFPAYSQMRTVPLLARGATYSSADTALSIADTIP